MQHPKNRETILQGTAVSPGIGFAPVHVLARGVATPEVYSIPKHRIEEEKNRFTEAVERTRLQLERLQDEIERLSGEDEGLIFEAHLMVLEDPALNKRTNKAIEERQQNAEFAFFAVIGTYVEAMRRVNDPYLAERATDIDDVAQRVLKNFSDTASEERDSPDHRHIIVAFDLSPSDTASMDRKEMLGFATEQGSRNSHTAILARSLGIPAVVGLAEAVLDVREDQPAILDGFSGKLILNPSHKTVRFYEELQKEKKKEERSLKELREKRTQTKDGRSITLSANIEFDHEISQVQESGAEGVGLFRSEFFLLDNDEIPGEASQAEVYTRIAKGTNPHQAIIRTLDAGGDKLPAEPLSEAEPNPFLGWRGIRVSLSRIPMFKDQLRAVLRASAHGKLGLMFPLVSGLTELRMAKETLKECMEELHNENIAFDDKIDVGVMIEVPSAAIMADMLAKEVDFFSIGTNDLIQYTVAVDRINKQVSNYYRPTNPGVIRLIKTTINAANDNGIWTGICGEMAGQLELTPLLLGLGINELSVGTHQLPRIKKAVRSLDYQECSTMAEEALQQPFAIDILNLSMNMANSAYPDLLDEGAYGIKQGVSL